MEQAVRERQFIEQVGLFMENHGMPRMAGRLLGLLLICDPPEQSSAELAAVLTASKGSISTNTRLLLKGELIEKVAMPGQRGTWFRVRPHAWHQIMEHQLTGITSFRRLLDEGIGMMAGESAARIERLKEARDFYGFMETEFPLVLQHWRQRQGDS